MNNLPTTPTDAESCWVDWCQEPPGHDGRHIRFLGLVHPTPWNTVAAVLVTVEAGASTSWGLPVVSLVGKHAPRLSARLNWREAEALSGWLERAIEQHDPDAVVQRGMRGTVAPVEVHTDHEAGEWQHALLRLGASGTLEMTGCAVVIEHDDGVNAALRVHAPARTEVEHVREVVRDAAVALGIV